MAAVDAMHPFFIVSDVRRLAAFYETLGFRIRYSQPPEQPFFAIIGRDGAMLFLKSGDAAPLPNAARDPEMRWDAYCATADPDGLAAEFAGRGVVFSDALKDTHDGLRGFEVTDPDGHVLFFGRPRG